jgi:hypothetical protein
LMEAGNNTTTTTYCLFFFHTLSPSPTDLFSTPSALCSARAGQLLRAPVDPKPKSSTSTPTPKPARSSSCYSCFFPLFPTQLTLSYSK